MLMTIDDIKKRVEELAEKINAKADLLPTYGYSKDLAYPHIEVDTGGLLHYVIVERGQELERKTTHKLEDLLYWIFDDITFSMSCEYELQNRIEGKDCRRIMFAKQEELLGLLDNSWREQKVLEHQYILKNNPFDDLASLRATYLGQLTQQGFSEAEITQLAYQKYPTN